VGLLVRCNGFVCVADLTTSWCRFRIGHIPSVKFFLKQFLLEHEDLEVRTSEEAQKLALFMAIQCVESHLRDDDDDAMGQPNNMAEEACLWAIECLEQSEWETRALNCALQVCL
jgi:hypothetical protein